MKLRTEFQSIPSDWKITRDSPIITLGSCFADMMGSRLKKYLFQTISNPFGTIYNPLSISKLLDMIISGKNISQDEIFERDGNYFSWNFSLRGPSKEFIVTEINEALSETRKSLASNSVLMLTLGSAFAWKLKSSGEVVANCHKVPGTAFEKVLLGLDEMKRNVSESFSKLKAAFPGIKILLTVSPVRHTKEGLAENNLSKSLLRVLCNELVNAFPNAFYFPSYEIMMDDLRDYRFYKEDLIHVTSQGEDYIWEKFSEIYFGGEERKSFSEIDQLVSRMMHKPFDYSNEKYASFTNETLKMAIEIEKKFSVKGFSALIEKAIEEKME